MIDSLMNDIGIDGSNIAKSGVFQDANNMARAANEAQKLAQAKRAERERDEDSSGGGSGGVEGTDGGRS